MNSSRAYTLLEVLMVIGILSILGAAGAASYRNYAKNVEASGMTGSIVASLKGARTRAMAGESERRWGVHFVNAAQDYFEIFSTPTNYADGGTTIESTVYLQDNIRFTTPADSSTLDVIFTRGSGTTTPATVVIATQTESVTITVTSFGAVY